MQNEPYDELPDPSDFIPHPSTWDGKSVEDLIGAAHQGHFNLSQIPEVAKTVPAEFKEEAAGEREMYDEYNTEAYTQRFFEILAIDAADQALGRYSFFDNGRNADSESYSVMPKEEAFEYYNELKGIPEEEQKIGALFQQAASIERSELPVFSKGPEQPVRADPFLTGRSSMER